MRKFFCDILRDKGSTKFSITKFLAFSSFIFLISYLTHETFFIEKSNIDHTLVIELMGFIGTLVGLKNNWGRKNVSENSNLGKKDQNVVFEKKSDKEIIDEGVF